MITEVRVNFRQTCKQSTIQIQWLRPRSSTDTTRRRARLRKVRALKASFFLGLPRLNRSDLMLSTRLSDSTRNDPFCSQEAWKEMRPWLTSPCKDSSRGPSTFKSPVGTMQPWLKAPRLWLGPRWCTRRITASEAVNSSSRISLQISRQVALAKS